MTGPQHYLQAERLAGEAAELYASATSSVESVHFLLATASVHATLALAAASVAAFLETYVEQENDAADWSKALGLPAEAPS